MQSKNRLELVGSTSVKALQKWRKFWWVSLVVFLVFPWLVVDKHGREVFPFFNWALFALVTNSSHQFHVVIMEVDGEALPKPIKFSEADRLVAEPHNIQAYNLTQHWGGAVVADKHAKAARLRGLFEDQFLQPGMRYELIREHGSPIALWERQPEKVTYHGDYTVGSQSP